MAIFKKLRVSLAGSALALFFFSITVVAASASKAVTCHLNQRQLMLFFSSILIVFVCLLPGDALSANGGGAYQVAPQIAEEIIEATLPANWYRLYDSSSYYPPDPIGACYSIQHIQNWVAEDPEHHIATMVETMSPCYLCANPDHTIGRDNNGNYFCYGGCPEEYRMISLYDPANPDETDGLGLCVFCPDGYEYDIDTEFCEWDNPGPPPPSHILYVHSTGDGSGMISGPNINCGISYNDCSEVYLHGTAVTLTAHSDSGSIFTGWRGNGCSGTGSCNVTINKDMTIYAAFGKSSVNLAISMLLKPIPWLTCDEDEVRDCAGNCVDESTALSWIGDGFCDDGSMGIDLRCDAFQNDGGDCENIIILIPQ